MMARQTDRGALSLLSERGNFEHGNVRLRLIVRLSVRLSVRLRVRLSRRSQLYSVIPTSTRR